MEDGCWTPILEGETRDHALACVDEVAETLRTHSNQPESDGGLAGGSAGIGLLHAYLSGTEGDGESVAAGQACIEHAINCLGSQAMRPDLYAGFTGVAWAVAHVVEDPEDLTEEIDQALLGLLSHGSWPGDYDLISGLVGLGVYGLEALPGPGGQQIVERVVQLLADKAQREADGICWFTGPELLPPWQREQAPEGYYNLGLAHGIPGIVALLGGACAAGLAGELAPKLLEGAVSWLLARRISVEQGWTYWLTNSNRGEQARAAWCYGDPGVAVALWFAAQAVDRDDWAKEALEAARRCSRRPPETVGIHDAGLCHGAAGLGHIYNRLHQSSGCEELGQAARFWFEKTLSMRRNGQDVAGFPEFRPGDEEGEWHAVPGLLTGACGVALALHAAASDTAPDWDRLLLTSSPYVARGS